MSNTVSLGSCRPGTFALRIAGLSMAPGFRDGAYFFVDPDATERDRGFVLVRPANGAQHHLPPTVEEAGVRFLKALNREWPNRVAAVDQPVDGGLRQAGDFQHPAGGRSRSGAWVRLPVQVRVSLPPTSQHDGFGFAAARRPASGGSGTWGGVRLLPIGAHHGHPESCVSKAACLAFCYDLEGGLTAPSPPHHSARRATKPADLRRH